VAVVVAVRAGQVASVSILATGGPQPRLAGDRVVHRQDAKGSVNRDASLPRSRRTSLRKTSLRRSPKARRDRQMSKLRVTWTRSAIGYNKRQKATIEALGLHRLNETVVMPDNASSRGMIAHVEHLVRVEKVEDSGDSQS
jgi:large subunit ribosomal protein L30